LIERLVDEERNVVRAATKSLEKIGAGAVPYLLKSLEDKKLEAKILAARILGRIGKANPDAFEKMIPEIIKIFKEKDWDTSRYAANIFLCAGSQCEKAVKPLIKSLKEGNLKVKVCAILSLDNCKDLPYRL